MDKPDAPNTDVVQARTPEDLQKDLSEAKARLQRQVADFDNFRKRTLREKEDLLLHPFKELFRGLIPVIDNFERAIYSIASQQKPDEVALQGILIIYNQLTQALREHGMVPFNAVGQVFDPARHEAQEMTWSDEHPSGVVARDILPGYTYKGDMLRPARVVVSRGQQSVEPAAEGIVAEFDIDADERTVPDKTISAPPGSTPGTGG
jgi:molecular chaperone GrpE